MCWHHIVASHDGSPASAAAVLRAGKIAGDIGCRCSVLLFGDGPSPVTHPARSFALSGLPGIEVPRWAEANDADVIVMAGGLARTREAAAIIRRSAVPCLLVPAWQRRFTSLHVALDRTERGLQVLGPSRTAAASLSAEVDYVSVTGEGDEPVAATWIQDRAEVPAQVVTVLSGMPVPTLAAFMAHAREGVLVLGVRRGRSGSVPESSGVGRSLLRTADCAFLTVPL